MLQIKVCRPPGLLSACSDQASTRIVHPAAPNLSPSESGNLHKRKAPEDGSAESREVFCPCSVGPCTVLTSTKSHSQGRKFYRCPKTKVRLSSAELQATLEALEEDKALRCMSPRRRRVSVGSFSGRISQSCQESKQNRACLLVSSKTAVKRQMTAFRHPKHHSVSVDWRQSRSPPTARQTLVGCSTSAPKMR